METKYVVFLITLVFLVPMGTILAQRRSWIRDLCFGVMVLATTNTDLFDINLISREYYRAATRGIEISLIDFMALIVIFSSQAKVRVKPASYWFVTVYIVYAALTIPFNEPSLFGYFELSKLLRGLIVMVAAAYYVRGAREIRYLLLWLSVVAGYEGFAALQDRYIYGMHRVRATMGSYNLLAMYINMIAPILLSAALSDLTRWRKRAAVVGYLLCVICVILTISRAGVVVFVVTSGLVILTSGQLRITPKSFVVAVLALALGTGVAYRSIDTLQSRYQHATMEGDIGGERGRFIYFRLGKLVLEDHPFGIGLNNWSYIVTNQYYSKLGFDYVPYTGTDADMRGYTKKEAVNMVAPPAHNLILLTTAEVGYIGVAIFLAMWVRWMHMGYFFLRRKLPTDVLTRFGHGALFAVFAVFLSCATEYGFRHSPVFFLMHIIVGSMASARMVLKYKQAEHV